jgi:opacity protein-like surface antigen
MKRSRSLITHCVLAAMFVAPVWSASADTATPAAGTVLPNSTVLTLKVGAFNLNDDRQLLNNYEWDFSSSVTPYAIEIEGWSGADKRITLGGEFMFYQSRFKRSGAPTVIQSMHVRTLVAKPKYFFGGANDSWRPYLGVGLGVAQVSDDEGPIGGSATGPAMQAVAGMQWRSERIGIRAEYLYLHTDVEDESIQEVNASGRALLVGISIHFGRAR